MARLPVYRDYKTTRVAAVLKAGQNVTFTDAVVGDVVEVTIGASGGGGGGGGTPASSVVSETSFGQQPAVGSSTDFARGDHSHGTPAVPAHSSTTGLAWASSGHTGSSTAVATWNGNGNAEVVQATDDETMLVRRGGVLKWVPLIVGISVYADFTGELSVYIDETSPELYTGTVI